MSKEDPVIEEFRATGGQVDGPFKGAPLLLLHHVGKRTGAAHVCPLWYQAVDDSWAIFASMGGSDKNPHWFYNLVAQPDVIIEVGKETVDVRARELDGEEYNRIWMEHKTRWPFFAGYERKSSRDHIPGFILEER